MIKRLISLKNKYDHFPMPVKASVWFFVCAVLQRGISVVVTPIFTRLMTTDQYGQFNVFNSWLDILGVFISLRLYYGCYSQGIVKYDEFKDRFTSSLQGLSCVLAVVWLFVLICCKPIITAFSSFSLIHIILLVVLTWTAAVYNYWATYQRTQYLYKKLVLLTLLVSLLKPIVGIVLVVVSEDKATARIIGIALVEVALYTGLFVSQIRKGKVFFDRKIWKYALSFAVPLIPHYLSQTVLNSSDKIMIELMIDEGSAGVYSLGYSVAFIMLMVNTSLLQTLEPWIFKRIKDKELDKIGDIATIAIVVVAMFNFMLIGFAPELVRLFAPQAYHGAIWVIPPVSMSVYLIFLYGLFADFEFYYEKTGLITVSTSISAILNVVLNLVFVPRFGYVAAAYTTLICYGAYAFFHYIMMKKVIRENLNDVKVYDMKVILIITFAFFAVAFLIMGMYAITYFRILIVVGIALLALLASKNRIVMLLSVRGEEDK